MAITKVVLAKLSPTMEEGTIVKWSKKEGDAIKVGDVMAEIETDKANMEMEALGAGILRKILVPAGGKAPVGALIGVIADAGDDIAPLLATATAAPKPAAPAPPTAAAPAPAAPASAPSTSAPAGGTPPAPPPAAPAAAPAPAAPAPSAPSATPPAAAPPQSHVALPSATVSPAPVAPATGEASPGGRLKASPLARSIATRENIPLASVAGSGPGGRIVRADVLGYAPSPAAASAPATAPPPVPTIQAGEELPVSNMRKTIARRLAESKFTAPHFYVTVEIDMDAAVALREQILKVENVKVSYNDLVLKACAKALTRFPMVNATWLGDKIATHGEVSIGVAVSIPDGLITPVVRNADRKSIVEISNEVKDLAARARDKKLKPDEYVGSTFTVSNLGMFDVSEFTAIINPPESAILAVGAVQRVPVVKGDEIQPGYRMKVTLSCDHRVVDGALGAQFLSEVRRLLESPIALFV
jgi:pyruvate dehydrogenase E2 component (dihydrolipoamide acetyltransferase)